MNINILYRSLSKSEIKEFLQIHEDIVNKKRFRFDESGQLPKDKYENLKLDEYDMSTRLRSFMKAYSDLDWFNITESEFTSHRQIAESTWREFVELRGF